MPRIETPDNFPAKALREQLATGASVLAVIAGTRSHIQERGLSGFLSDLSGNAANDNTPTGLRSMRDIATILSNLQSEGIPSTLNRIPISESAQPFVTAAQALRNPAAFLNDQIAANENKAARANQQAAS